LPIHFLRKFILKKIKEQYMQSTHLSQTYDNLLLSGLFRNLLTAEKAYQEAFQCGFTQGEINILMLDYTKKDYINESKKFLSLEQPLIDNVSGQTLNGIYTALTVLDNQLIIHDLGLIVVGPLTNYLRRYRKLSNNMLETLLTCGVSESQARKYELGLLMGGIVLGVNSASKKHNNNKLKHDWKKLSVYKLKLVTA
jgi:hypothetical protein